MNSEEAKRILLAYRPGSKDAQDPEVAEALKFARDDAHLQHWLEEQAAFHRITRLEFHSIPVPSGLKARILTQERKIVPFWSRSEVWLAAASIVLTMTLTALWFGRSIEDQTFEGFRSRMVGFALRVYGMDIVTSNLGQIRNFLAQKGAPADYTLTAGLRTVPAKGGAALSWQAKPVAMVCFSLPQNQTLYMFVVNEGDIPRGKPPADGPVWADIGGITTTSWRHQGKVYLLIAKDPAVLKHTVP